MKTLKLLLLLLINSLLFGQSKLQACGFSLYKEEWRFWTFDPTIGAEPGLRPMYYSIDFFHKGFQKSSYYEDEGDGQADPNGEYATNIRQWLRVCKQLEPKAAITEKDITVILYETEPQDYFLLREGLIKENLFMAFLYRHRAYLQYMDFAKKCEYFSNFPSETWGCYDCPKIVAPGKTVSGERYGYHWYESVPYDSIQTPILFITGDDLLKSTKDLFLKQRIAYQMVRLSFYQGLTEQTHAYFNQYLAALPANSWLKNNAFMYTVLHLEGVERNLGLAKIFELCPDKRYRCVQLFEKKLFQETLAKTKNKHDEVYVRILYAINQPMEQLENLQQIARLEPKNPLLPMLWVREINKLEDWVMGPVYTEFGSTRNEYWDDEIKTVILQQKRNDLLYASKVAAALANMYALSSGNQKDFYALCNGFVLFMQKNLKAAEWAYKQVNPKKLSQVAQVQYQLCLVMLHLSQSEKITPQLENEVAGVFNFLQRTQIQFPQRREMLFSLLNYMANEFILRGEKVKGLMMFGFSAKPYKGHPLLGLANVYTQLYTYASVADMSAVLQILQNKKPSPLEKFLQGQIFKYTYDYDYYDENPKEPWNLNKLRDIKSMKLVQADKLYEAYLTVKEIDTAYWSNDVFSYFKADNPFCLNPWQTHLPMNFTHVTYTKVSFLKTLIDLKNSLPKLHGEQKAQTLMSIANAYYSMSFNGKYWIMQKNYQGGGEPWEDSSDVDPTYYSGARAKYYFKQVLQNAKDPKLIAGTVYILQVAFENTNAQMAANKAVLKNNPVASDIYEQMSWNCDLFYEFIKTYNYFGPSKKINARTS